MKNRVLYSSLLVALVGFSSPLVAQTTSPVQAISSPTPSAVPSVAPAQAAPASNPQVVINTPNTNVVVPQPAVVVPVPASNAGVSTLQQTINNSATPSVSPAGVSFATSDESTLLREMSRQQARLAFLNMMSKIEKAQLDIERDRLKFEQEKREAEAAIQKVSAPSLPSMPLSSSGAVSSGSVADLVASISKPSVRSIYSYDGTYFAEIFTDNQKTIARSGTVLPNGARVASITSSGVVVIQQGKRLTLMVEPPSSTLSSAGPLSTPSSVPGALPPIP